MFPMVRSPFSLSQGPLARYFQPKAAPQAALSQQLQGPFFLCLLRFELLRFRNSYGKKDQQWWLNANTQESYFDYMYLHYITMFVGICWNDQLIMVT